MLKDNRKTRRQPMHYTAWIAPKSGELHGCELSDISDTGARARALYRALTQMSWLRATLAPL
jgi:hypothetical protein